MRSSEPHLPPPLCLRETHRVVAASPRITPPVRSITTYSFFLIIRIRLFVRLITRVHMPRFLFNIQVAVTKKERRRTLAGLHPELPILIKLRFQLMAVGSMHVAFTSLLHYKISSVSCMNLVFYNLCSFKYGPKLNKNCQFALSFGRRYKLKSRRNSLTQT
jgi:hypothetical protein